MHLYPIRVSRPQAICIFFQAPANKCVQIRGGGEGEEGRGEEGGRKRVN